jgi:hypothetical protein
VNIVGRSGVVHTEFAARLKLALDEAGVGKCQLKELGAMFKVTPQAFRKWLDGEAMPVSKRAPEVARLLGVRRAWLLDGELPMRPVSAEMAESGKDYSTRDELLSISGEEFKLLRNYRKLPRNLQTLVGAIVETTGSELQK